MWLGEACKDIYIYIYIYKVLVGRFVACVGSSGCHVRWDIDISTYIYIYVKYS